MPTGSEIMTLAKFFGLNLLKFQRTARGTRSALMVNFVKHQKKKNVLYIFGKLRFLRFE